MPLVSISNAQRRPMPANANWLATIPHGLVSHVCPFDPEGGSYLAFLGRISPEKRPDRAIEIAKRAGLPLKLAAKVDAVDVEYFETEIEPLLDHPLIEFIGEIDETQKCEFLGNARALLFPIDWPEPFGLVMIEAMSAGTPVIAWPMDMCGKSSPRASAAGLSTRSRRRWRLCNKPLTWTGARFALNLKRGSPRRGWREHMSRRIVRSWRAYRQTPKLPSFPYRLCPA